MVAVSTTNFKVLDVEIMSRHCKACNAKESLKENKELYEEWKVNHQSQCNANYSGSAPGMETEGAIRIFSRSVKKYGVRYLSYYGEVMVIAKLSRKSKIFIQAARLSNTSALNTIKRGLATVFENLEIVQKDLVAKTNRHQVMEFKNPKVD